MGALIVCRNVDTVCKVNLVRIYKQKQQRFTQNNKSYYNPTTKQSLNVFLQIGGF